MKNLALALSVVSLASSFYLYEELRWIGFPDGHRTEFERVFEHNFQFILCLNVVYAILFLFVVAMPKIREQLAKRFALIAWLYGLFFVGAGGLWIYLATHLENGGGG